MNSYVRYADLGKVIEQAGVQPGDIVMVNNPPGYYLATGEPSVAIPNGGVETLLAAARRYNARYVLLEANHPEGLNDLYNQAKDCPGLHYMTSNGDAILYEIIQEFTVDEDG